MNNVTKFKVGDKVKIARTSEYYGGSFNNPADLVGEVTEINNRKYLPIEVKWGENLKNSYGEKDLVSIELDKETVDKLAQDFKEESFKESFDCYTLIPNHNLTVQYKGQVVSIDNTHPLFYSAVQAAQGANLEEAYNLADTRQAINEYMKGCIVIKDETVYYKGEEVTSELSKRIIHQMQEGDEGFKALVAFMDKLEENPSFKARMELFGFVSHTDIEITPEGDLICWKKIRKDWTDCHTGTIDNSVGANPKMAREKVNDDSNQTCSAGLHVAAKSYLKHFHGERTIKCLVNPKNVVSIPVDYNNSKMRVSEYLVLEEVDSF